MSLTIRKLLLKQYSVGIKSIRTFLSNAYSCNEVWEQRKRSPIFQKIDYDDLYHQLDRSFQIGYRISVLDVDLFVNGVDSSLFINELEDILFKLRLNPETGLLSERTMHAVAKYYIAINEKEKLLSILSNRLNFGIFADYYIANMLMDNFIKEGKFVCATKVAAILMLQEDFNHPITRILSIYSCIKYLNSTEIWAPPKEPEENPDDDEEVKVRVSFIRNPYYDDHFDIVNPNHLVGKSLYMAAEGLGGPIGLSSQIIGLVLHEKYDKVLNLLKNVIQSNSEVYEDALNKATEYCINLPKQSENSKVPERDDAVVGSVLNELRNALKSAKIISEDFETVVSKAVLNTIEANESQDVQNLSKLYRTWEEEREKHIQYEITEKNKREAAEKIANLKDDLKKREEMIFYFDNEDTWNLKVEQKQEEQKILAEAESKIKKKSQEEDYIPPEVGQRRV